MEKNFDFIKNLLNNIPLLKWVKKFSADGLQEEIKGESFDVETCDNSVCVADTGVVKMFFSSSRFSGKTYVSFDIKHIKEVLSLIEGEGRLIINDSEDKLIRGFQFLSQKPLMAVLNCDESHYGTRLDYESTFKENLPKIPVTSVSALAEKEIQELDADERAMFMEELGIDEPAINHVIATSYAAIGLISFFTVGEDEVRAWNLHTPATAPEAAGAIHSDLQKGFIRAEVITYDDFMREGGMSKAKAKGLVHLEGKEYIVKDGDILNIRFNI